MNILTTVRPPSGFSCCERAAFIRMAKEGNPVNSGTVKPNVDRAELLATTTDDATLIAIAAVKNPDILYRNRCFKKAGVLKEAELYPVELGYVQTAEGYKCEGYASSLAKRILDTFGSGPIYATTENPYMKKMLTRLGFVPLGTTYKAKDGKGELTLLVRNTLS